MSQAAFPSLTEEQQ